MLEWRLATPNASSPTTSHALQQVKFKSCSNRSHLSGCFKCSSLLACQAPRVQLSNCFPISPSRIHLTASLYLCPADCFQDILFEQAGNSHWKKLAFLQYFASNLSSASSNIAFFKCSSLLACKAARVQLSICFPISPSRIHLTASLYLCPADCFQDSLFKQAGNSHWKKLAFLRHVK